MSAHAYTEDQLVEQPANAGRRPSPWPSPSGRGNDGLIAEYSAGPSPHARPFSHWEKGGRQAGLRVRSLVLVSRLRAALERLNPARPPEAIIAAVDELTRDRSAMSLEAANREVYLLLKEGIKVSVPEPDSTPHPGPLPGRGGEGVRSGGQKTERLRVIDWEQPANNDFLLVSQFSVTGARRKCRMTNFDCRTD